jgi:hypothetical protein
MKGSHRQVIGSGGMRGIIAEHYLNSGSHFTCGPVCECNRYNLLRGDAKFGDLVNNAMGENPGFA